MTRAKEKSPSKPKRPAKKKAGGDWRDHPKRWVHGCIDSHGAIRATATVEIEMHNLETSKGKRWRFNVAAQDMVSLAPRTVEEAHHRIRLLTLNEEEYFTVCDWLIRHGFADESILPIKRPGA